jgi:hypothetical protein
MKKKAITLGFIIIFSAIIWGAVIVGCSLVLRETECYHEIQNILVGGTFAHIILLGGLNSALIIRSKKELKEKV